MKLTFAASLLLYAVFAFFLFMGSITGHTIFQIMAPIYFLFATTLGLLARKRIERSSAADPPRRYAFASLAIAVGLYILFVVGLLLTDRLWH